MLTDGCILTDNLFEKVSETLKVLIVIKKMIRVTEISKYE